MIKLGVARKFVAILANVSLLFNSFVPFLLAVQPVYAQEAPAVEEVIVEPTPEITPEITPIAEITPEPILEPTPILEPIIEITPTPEPTPAPEITPEPVNVEIGVLTSPVVESTPTPEPLVEPSVNPEPTPAPENIISQQAFPIETPVFEKICLTDEQIKDTTNEEWIINDTTGISETKGKVQLGVRYVYPQENKVSVTFKCLPKDENLRTSLKIEKIKTADLNLPDTMGSVGEYAYDITTDMKNGDFEYDVTLPKPENSTAEISYIEKSVDEAKSNLTFFDINQIDNSKVEQSSDTVKATGVDHFTIFIASTHQGELSAGGFSGGNITTYSEGNDINFRFNISSNGEGSGTVEVRFTGQESACLFFTDSFSLGDIAVVSGVIPNVTLLGAVTKDSDEWVQIIKVDYTSAGESIINYTLTLSDEAGACNGSSQHSRLGNVTGDFKNTGVQNVPIPAKDIVVLPDIIISKGLDENGDGNIDRHATAGEWSFTLNGVITFSTDETGKVIFENVPSGSHTITETGPDGYTFLKGSGDCMFNSDGTATLDFTATTDTTDKYCVFTNTLQKSNLTLVKNIINDNGGNALATDWVLSATGPTNISGVSGNAAVTNVQVINGTYTLAESSGPSGYIAGDWTCTNSVIVTNNKITLNPGQSTTCTITNDDQTPTLTLIKSWTDIYDSGYTINDWTLSAIGTGSSLVGKSGVTNNVLAGTYTLFESGPTGTNSSSWDCTGGVTPNGNILTVSLGQNITCTITNTPIQPRLTVIKKVIGSTESISNFSLFVDSTPVTSGVRNDFNVGTYTVSETPNSNYTISFSDDCDSFGSVSLKLADDKTCTITNTRKTGNIKFDKVVNGGTALDTDWTFTISGQGTAKDGDTKTYDTGSYTVTEDGAPNYTLTGASGLCSMDPSTKVITLNVSTEGGTCTITNTRDTGTLRVLKNVDLNGDGDYIDAGESGATNWHWQIDGGSDHHTGDNAITLSTGTYHLTETNQTNYHVTGLTCTPNGSVDGSDVTINKGVNVVCTFTNARDTGTLIVQKTTIPASEDTSFSITASGTGTIVNGTSGTVKDNLDKTYTVTTGTYSVNETVPTGWTKTGDTCQNVVVGVNETKYCTITNTKKASLKIIKDSQPDDTQNFIFKLKDSNNVQIGSTELDDDNVANSRPNNYIFTNLIPGLYKVFEDSTSGWTLDNISCNAQGEWNSSGGYLTINVLPGEQAVCTFTNGLDTGSLAALKYEDKNNNQQQNDGEYGLGNWEMKLYKGNSCSGSSIKTINTNSSGEADFGNLVPGNYSIKETMKSGWDNSTPLCQNITINHNDDKILKFGNYKLGKIEGRKFYDKNGDGNRDSGEDYLADWRIFIDQNGNNLYNYGEPHYHTDNNGYYKFDNLALGNYTICEQMKPGWYNSTPICTTTTITPNDTDTINFGNIRYGSINVCKVILDTTGQIANGSALSNSVFSISGLNQSTSQGSPAGVLGTTTFTTPLSFDTKLFNSQVNNAECTLHSNLKIGNYYYGQESIPGSVWSTPKYNDGANGIPQSISDNFYEYSGQLFDSNPNNDGNRQTSSDGHVVLSSDNRDRTLVILNQYKYGSINVTKFNDVNGNGKKDEGEDNLLGWTINLTDQESIVTNQDGQAVFDNLIPETYYLSEKIKPGWTQTAITCNNEEESEINKIGVCHWNNGADKWNYLSILQNNPGHIGNHDNDYPYRGSKNPTKKDGDDWCASNVPTEADSNFRVSQVLDQVDDIYPVTVNAGDNIICYIGNQRLDPRATIAKSNNVLGDLSPGDSVEYKIKLNIHDNDVTGFKVTDLLSNGFKYRAGSYKVTKNGVDYPITEPVYHSPGVWNLGDLDAGDELELTYIADISSDQHAGKYADLAWASGKAAYDESNLVLAVGEDSTYVDGNFVGTQVPVVKNYQNTTSAGVEKIENIEGEVLGATTELPGTGAATLWLIISGLLGIAGFSFLKISKKTMMTILLTILSFGLLFNPIKAAENLVIRLEEPKSPINTRDIDLKFVALDISNRPITVKCFKKGPTDSDFSQFNSDTILTDGGNSSSCFLSSVINNNGSYQFKVTALAGVDSSESQIVNLDYKTSSPDTPSYYSKEEINNCDYKIKFKTADDGGKTVKVEVYRSDKTSFDLNSDTLIAGINVSSNQEYNIINSVPDCNKDYYFVIRAFDDAGNGSSTVGDSVVITNITNPTTTTTTTTGSVSGAIPVIGDDNIPQEGTETDQENISEENQEGSILGTETPTNPKSITTQFQSFISRHKFTSAGIALLTLVIIGYVVKKIGKKKR